MKKHQIGVIGFGVWGCHSLERELAATGRCEIRKIYAVDDLGDNCHGPALRQEAAAFAAVNGAEIVTNWRAVLDDPEIDIVSVMTAPCRKPFFLKAVTDAGKLAVTDKPLGMNSNELTELKNIAPHQLFMLAGYWNRPGVAEVIRMIRGGEIGKPLAVAIRLNFMGGIFPGFAPSRRWRTEIPSAELTTIGSHALVTVQQLLTEPITRIYVELGEFFYAPYHAVHAEDWAELNCRSRSGVPVSISVGRTPHRIPGEDIIVEVTGETGYARYSGGKLECFTAMHGMEHREFPAWSLTETFHTCLDAWEHRAPQRVTIADGMELQAVLDAALHSAQTHQTETIQA